MQRKPEMIKRYLSLGIKSFACEKSRRMNPIPPIANMAPADKPSMMNWPLTRYWRKARGLTAPFSSVVLPIEGGSTMMS